MVTMGRLIFKATGVMSNRGLAKNANKIGEAIAEAAKTSGGEINTARVRQIVSDTIGKKAASRINFLDRQAFREKALAMGLPEGAVQHTFDVCGGVTLPEKYARRADIFINEGFAKGADGVEIVSHELQHALSFSSGKLSIGRWLGKFQRGRNFLDKMADKSIQYGMQDKYLQLQLAARAQKNITPEAIRELLYSKGILKVGDNKANAYILKQLRAIYKDEVRSYSVGFGAKENYLGKISPQDKEVVDVYRNLVQGCSQEAKHISANRIRKFFGLKPNTAREREIIQATEQRQAEILRNVKACEVKSGDLPENLKKDLFS